MTDFIGAVWIGTMCAWFGYCVAEHRHRNDLPQWKAALGNVLVRQFAEIRKFERFAGCSPRCEITIEDDDEAFRLTVERTEVEA